MSQHRIPSDLDPSRSMTSGASPSKDFTKNPEKSFSSLMQNNPIEQNAEQMINPLQLAQIATAGPPNPHTLLAQVQLAQNNMLNIKEHISNPNLKLNASEKSILKSKLTSANSKLQAIDLKLGGTLDGKNDDAGDAPSKGSGPIAQYLGLLTNGLSSLESVKHGIKTVSNVGTLSPADFLTMQVKLSKATQELEFAGVLLSKTLDGFKQLMSVQL
ncbi:MAG: hypothetical protein JSS09_02385 [Verrucomicrobia bacterium]|nr:hypothetical protein [Verrucomicrobiota bacterium]